MQLIGVGRTSLRRVVRPTLLLVQFFPSLLSFVRVDANFTKLSLS
jgi:hypothetical protein